MGTADWRYVNPPEFWAIAVAYLNEIDRQLLDLKKHPSRYFESIQLNQQAHDLRQLIKLIRHELEKGMIDPTSLPPASPVAFFEGTSIYQPINLNKPDYRRLTKNDWSAFYRLDYSLNPRRCAGVRIFFRPDEPEHIEKALEALYQQMYKAAWE